MYLDGGGYRQKGRGSFGGILQECDFVYTSCVLFLSCCVCVSDRSYFRTVLDACVVKHFCSDGAAAQQLSTPADVCLTQLDTGI